MRRAEYTKLILDQMSAVLGPAGFRNRAKSFYAEREDTVLLVQLQRDRYSTHGWLGVTVNLAVHSRMLAAQNVDWFATIAGYGCHWYERIGFVAPHDTDYWWEIDDPVTAVEVGAEIAALLRLYCIPTLERLASTAKLRAYWLGGGCDGTTDVLRSRYLAALDRAIQ